MLWKEGKSAVETAEESGVLRRKKDKSVENDSEKKGNLKFDRRDTKQQKYIPAVASRVHVSGMRGQVSHAAKSKQKGCLPPFVSPHASLFLLMPLDATCGERQNKKLVFLSRVFQVSLFPFMPLDERRTAGSACSAVQATAVSA